MDMHWIPFFSTIVTFFFAAAVFHRWHYKKPRHLILWGIGLIWYGLGTLSEVVLGFTFSPLMLRVWYLSGAMLTAAWLGQGTVYLLVRKRGVANGLMALLGIATLVAIGLIVAAPLDVNAAFDITRPISIQYKDILTRSGPMILLTVLLNVYGTITLVGGAIYSAFLFWRKNILINRMLGNVLIAAGALAPALAGSFVKAGLVDLLYLSELVGVVLMYSGFMLATARQPSERAVAVMAS